MALRVGLRTKHINIVYLLASIVPAICLAVIPSREGQGASLSRNAEALARSQEQTTPRSLLSSSRDVAPLGEAALNSQNPTSPAKVALGKRLFFEPLLSGSNKQSCASCHQPDHGFADTRRLSLGDDGKTVARNTPSLWNAVYSPFLFWDGRVGSLEAQALLPVANPAEMNQKVDLLPQELASAGYGKAFQQVWGDSSITARRIGDALAAYERSLTLADTRLDRWLRGDKNAMSYEAVRGLLIFSGDKARCTSCHGGPNLSRAQANDSASFVRIGVRALPGDPEDGGRAKVPGEVPRMEQLFARTGAFRIPPLRGVADTAPYMHNGSLPTLEAVVDFYNRGGDEERLPPLGLTPDEKRFLIAFLREGVSK